MSERGKYIVIEGHDGTGKSEQAFRLRRHLGLQGIKVADFIVEEPDGATNDSGETVVPVATELRKIIKNADLDRDPWTNVGLFTAARRENWLQAMNPALERGEWVVTARNWLSTVAYQGYGEGVSLKRIEKRTLEDVGEQYMIPNLTLVLNLDNHISRAQRIGQRGNLENPDTFESKPHDFQERVKNGYLNYAQEHGIAIIDASGSKEEVEKDICQHIKDLMPT